MNDMLPGRQHENIVITPGLGVKASLNLNICWMNFQLTLKLKN